MSKVTKKDLNERLLMVETLLGLHRVLPEQISNEQATNAIFRMQCALNSGKELAEREQPKLKQLDQSIFKHLADCWKFFAIDKNGEAWCYLEEPKIDDGDTRWLSRNTTLIKIGEGYDTTDWQNSLIERDKVELTGSDLARAMLERGDKFVMCQTASGVDVISGTYEDGFFVSISNEYEDVTPINNQGEPLTAAEVGL